MTARKEPKPLYDKIVVYRHEKESTSAGGIVLTDVNNDGKPCFGTVLAVGPGRQLQDGTLAPLQVKKGDTIVFGKYSGVEIEAGGRKVLVMREEDVLAIV